MHSPVWVPTAQAANRDLLASVVDPSAKPEFVTASRAQNLIWPDPRILPKRLASGAAETGDKAKWTLPIVVAGKRVTLRGTTVLAEVKPEFTPAPVESAEPVQTTPPADAAASATPKGGATAIVIGGIAAAVCVLAAGALVVRRAPRLSLNPGLNEEGRHGPPLSVPLPSDPQALMMPVLHRRHRDDSGVRFVTGYGCDSSGGGHINYLPTVSQSPVCGNRADGETGRQIAARPFVLLS